MMSDINLYISYSYIAHPYIITYIIYTPLAILQYTSYLLFIANGLYYYLFIIFIAYHFSSVINIKMIGEKEK